MTSPEQILEILKAVRTKPKWPSQVSIPGLDDFNPQHQQEKLKLFEKLSVEGFLTRVPGKTGVRTGLGFGITEKGQAELKLPQKVGDPNPEVLVELYLRVFCAYVD